MIASNHVALYIQILAVSVLYELSIKVPKAIAVANRIKRMAIKRVEKKIFLSSSVIAGIEVLFQAQKYSLFMILTANATFKKLNKFVNYFLSQHCINLYFWA